MEVILHLLTVAIIASFASFFIVWIAFGKSPKSTSNSDTDKKETPTMSNTIASASTKELAVGAHFAEVIIQHGDVQDIIIEANNHEEFDISQNGECLTIKEKDSFGGCISNVYQSNTSGRNTVSVTGKTYIGNSVSMINGKVFIDGKPAQEIDSAPAKDRNRLQITLPNGYAGNLRLDGSGISKVRLDSWAGFKLKLNLSGQAGFVAQTIRVSEIKCDLSGITHATLDMGDCADAYIEISGQSEFDIATLEAGKADIRCSGISTARIKSGSANRTSLEASGQSRITCSGDFANVNRCKSGLAEISINQ